MSENRKLSVSQAISNPDKKQKEKEKEYDSDDELTLLPSQIRFYDTIKHFREEIDEEERNPMLASTKKAAPREYTFPNTLHSEDRKVIHFLAKKFGLISRSDGKGKARVVSIQYVPKNETELTLSKSLKKKFVKHWELPFPLIESPYFEYYIDLYDEMFGTKRKMKMFREQLKEVEKEHPPEYIGKHYKAIKNRIVEILKEKPAFKQFLEKEQDLLKFYRIDFNEEKSTNSEKSTWFQNFKKAMDRDIWSPRSHGRCFISLDLRNARFNALKYHDPELVLNSANWKELLQKLELYTPYFHESKFWRASVFEELGGELQRSIISWMIYQIAQGLIDDEYFHPREFVSFCDVDEMLLFTTKETWRGDCNRIAKFLAEKHPNFASIVKIEPFQVTQMSRDQQFFLKEIFPFKATSSQNNQNFKLNQSTSISPSFNGSSSSQLLKKAPLSKRIQIKCEPEFWPQCYKYYKGIDPDERDRKVLFKTRFGEYLATLDRNIFD